MAINLFFFFISLFNVGTAHSIDSKFNTAHTLDSKYDCALCQAVVRNVPCSYFNACDIVNASILKKIGSCEAAGFCNRVHHLPVLSPTNQSGLNVRVSKGFGTKHYSSIRLSVITKKNSTPPFDPSSFEYSSQFKYRWTENVLHSSIVKVKPGEMNRLTIGSTNLSIWLPKQGAGVAGLLIADPCIYDASFISEVGCVFAEKFQVKKRLPEMMNAIVSDPDTDYWGILGDNFYDRIGEGTDYVFSNFSLKTKSKLFIAVPGNHDYWIFGGPSLGTTYDQWGNGYMQYYTMDVKAAENILPGKSNSFLNPDNVGIPPFNFSIDPSAGHEVVGGNLPDISNTIWYQQIGNIAIVGYSSAYSYQVTEPFLKEACQWIGNLYDSKKISLALLVGHWDKIDFGCKLGMSAPLVYDHISQFDGCRQLHERSLLKFFMGHQHCNRPHPHGRVGAGFMAGGQGMTGCGNYGFPILDTTMNRVRVWYFEFVTIDGADVYDEKYKCISENGWRQCLHLAEIWLDQPLVIPPLQ